LLVSGVGVTSRVIARLLLKQAGVKRIAADTGAVNRQRTAAMEKIDSQQRVVYGRTICAEKRRLDDPQRSFTRG